MNRRPRWGIVGTGGISRTTVGDLQLTENVDLVAVASRTDADAESFAARHEVPRWPGDYDALFADEDVDVVYICTPIGTHFDVVRRALLSGKHVLLEKAFTTTADEARELAGLAAERGRFLMEAMWCGSTRRSSGSWTRSRPATSATSGPSRRFRLPAVNY